MKSVWTVWADYGGTGEGQTMLVWIGYAEDHVFAQNAFSDRFGSFFGSLSIAEQGVIENAVTRVLIPAETVQLLQRASGKAHVEYFTQLYLNAS